MLFSVLLSLYHKESPLFLRQSLTSIFTQTLLPIEVVLVEDGPLTDELYAVIKEFTSQHPELKVISLPTIHYLYSVRPHFIYNLCISIICSCFHLV